MEQEYKQIRKGSGFVYACASMLYRRVTTEGNIKYLKCRVAGCVGSQSSDLRQAANYRI